MDPSALSDLLAKLARDRRVPGAQLAVHLGGRLLTAEYGVETHGGDAPVTRATAFPLASLTKPFTATLAAMLVQDGDVGFDEPLTRVIPGPAAPAGTPTLRGLLSHTGGLAADASDASDASDAETNGHAAGNGTRRPDRRYGPAWPGVGPAFSYSNAGYALTGRLVEAVTAMTWREAVEELLLAPLDIAPSFATGPRTRRRIATGHSVHPARGDVLPLAAEPDDPDDDPAGALALSAADLVALARLHLADPALPGLLDEDVLPPMREDRTAGLPIGPYGLADGWGLGWAIHRRDGTDWLGHDGSGDGASCHLRFSPADGTVVALTANANTGLALWRDLVERLARSGVTVGDHRPLAAVGPAVPGPAERAGTYANGQAVFDVVAAPGGGLLLRSIGAITCYRGLVFAVGEPYGGLTHAGRFLRGKGGGDLIQVTGRLARRVAGEARPGGTRS